MGFEWFFHVGCHTVEGWGGKYFYAEFWWSGEFVAAVWFGEDCF